MKPSKAILIPLVTIFLTTLVQAEKAGEKVTSADIMEDTQQLIDTLQQYGVEKRDEAIAEAEKALTKLDGEIDALEDQIDENWDEMSKSARQKSREMLRTLRDQRKQVAEWYGSLKTSSAGAWEQMKAGFSESYSVLSDSWDKAKAEFNNGDK